MTAAMTASSDTKPADEFAQAVNRHLSYLVAFARQANELDLLASTNPEFRGAQDGGWNTTITAFEVFEELKALGTAKRSLTRPEARQVFSLYAQLAEAGGFYETLSNVIGILEQRPYTGWPFQPLVKVKKRPHRIIGPNANAVFRNLASKAEEVGLLGLASVLEGAFRDDLRNALAHADYIIAPDGIRLRRRNGGYASVVVWEEFGEAVTRGLAFFDLVQQHWGEVVRSYDPPRTVIGRFSANPPMEYEVAFDAQSGSFSISTSSVGFARSPAYNRQEAINEALNKSVFTMFTSTESEETARIVRELATAGFGCRIAMFPNDAEVLNLRNDARARDLWDRRAAEQGDGTLMASPFGFFDVIAGEEFTARILPPVEDVIVAN